MAPGPDWTGAENLAPFRIQSPARSESLYRLSYPGRLEARYYAILSRHLLKLPLISKYSPHRHIHGHFRYIRPLIVDKKLHSHSKQVKKEISLVYLTFTILYIRIRDERLSVKL